MSTPTQNDRIVLASRPVGAPVAANFRHETGPIPVAGAGEVLLKIRYLSLDPYMRGRMSDAKSYAAPVAVGDVMEGGTVGEVLQSQDPAFSPGDLVLSYSGWQAFAVAPGASLRKLDPAQAPVTTALGVMGMPGFTAYAGLEFIGKPKAGETVVVAAASGPVGATVGQISRLKGACAIGIAGGPDKCAYVRDELGFDAVVDHRSATFADDLKAACPDGIDVYFENVGGKVFEAVLPLLNPFARIPVCGLVSGYNSTGPFEGPNLLPVLMRDVLTKSLTVRGFIQNEFAAHRDVFYGQMADWIAAGRVKYREDVVEGLGQAPQALVGLLDGRNFGKVIVHVG